MQDWLQDIFLDNSPRAFALAFGWSLGGAVLLLVARTLVVQRMTAPERRHRAADDVIVALLQSIRPSYLLLFAIGAAIRFLAMPFGVQAWTGRVMILITALQLIRTGDRVIGVWVKSYAERRQGVDQTTLTALSYGAKIVLWAVVLLVALDAAGFKVSTLLAGAGITGIAIALAVQNILGDLFAALSIVLDKPFVVGDYIAVDAFEGSVAHVGLKSTRVRSVNGEEVVFANADLLKSRLRNLTRRQSRRYVLTLTVTSDTRAEKLAQVPKLAAEAVAADSRATLQYAHLTGVTPVGFVVEVAIGIPNPAPLHGLDVRQSIMLDIIGRLQREGITLARQTFLPADAPPAVPATLQ